MEGALKKKSSNVYLLGTKSIILELKQQKIVCKVGGGYQSLEQLLHSSSARPSPHSLTETDSKQSIKEYLAGLRSGPSGHPRGE